MPIFKLGKPSSISALSLPQLRTRCVPLQVCPATLSLMRQASVWDPDSHHLFPEPFQQAVVHLLVLHWRLRNAVSYAPPPELWIIILGFLARDFTWKVWFAAL